MLFTIVRQDITKMKVDTKGKYDVEVYKQAILDRELFSKIKKERLHPQQAHRGRPSGGSGV